MIKVTYAKHLFIPSKKYPHLKKKMYFYIKKYFSFRNGVQYRIYLDSYYSEKHKKLEDCMTELIEYLYEHGGKIY